MASSKSSSRKGLGRKSIAPALRVGYIVAGWDMLATPSAACMPWPRAGTEADGDAEPEAVPEPESEQYAPEDFAGLIVDVDVFNTVVVDDDVRDLLR